MSTMTSGTVKWFNSEKGIGFIQQQNGPDVFVHVTNIVEKQGKKSLNEGQQVQFNIMKGPRGLQAEQVRVIN